MSYTALYRKFRPQKFEDVKGQDHIVTTIRNQIRSDKIQHAYLFCGTRGTGKTSVAKLFAKAINCEHPVGENPCMECAFCKAVQAGTTMNVVEIDAASNNGVDNIRQIIEEVSYPPTEGRYKVYIIDEVHMLSIGAFNALLKTLEEPPSYVVFILATTEVHKLPVTILSRCQRYDFKRIGVDDIVERINELLPEEGIEADEAAIRYIARAADGALRDALSLLDQCAAFNFGKRLTYEMVLDTLGAVNSTVFSDLLRMIMTRDVTGAIYMLEKIIMEGRELGQFVTDFTWYIRNLLLAITSDDVEAVVDMSKENLDRLKEEAKEISVDKAMRYIRILSELTNQIRYATNKRVLVELAIIKMCEPRTESEPDTLSSRIEAIEKSLENGSMVPVSAPASQVQEQPRKPEAPLPKPESLPEDVRRVAENWREVLNREAYPQKAYLKRAIPSLGSSGELIIAFEQPIHRDYYLGGDGRNGHMDELKDIVDSVAGSDVRISLEVSKEAGSPEGTDFPNLTRLFGNSNLIIEEE